MKLLNLPQYFKHIELGIKDSLTGYVDPRVNVLVGPRKTYESRIRFLPLLDDWLADMRRPLLMLLGDYGQGKTTCCEHVVRMYLDDPTVFAGRIPLYVRLRDVANQGYDLQAMLRVCLHERLGLNYSSFEILNYLARQSSFLFLFDGLDEISFTFQWSAIFDSLKQICRLAFKGNKVIVTARPGAFSHTVPLASSLERLNVLVNIGDESAYPGTTYIAARLEYFTEPEVRQAVANSGLHEVDEFLQKIHNIHDLSDLATRPIALRMLLESLDEIREGALQTQGDLYRTYTSRWLSRDAWRSGIEGMSMHIGRDLKEEFVAGSIR